MNIDDLQKRLKQTPDPVDKYIRNVLIEFDSDKVSVKHFVKELKILLNTNNITMYDGRIVAWLSGSNNIFMPEFDEIKFDKLLKKVVVNLVDEEGHNIAKPQPFDEQVGDVRGV